MGTAGAKRFEYTAAVDRAGQVSAENGAPVALGEEWSPEALVLAGLGRCTLTSLRFHAARQGIDIVGSASARGAVTRRESDGRYAFVELACDLDVELEPEPDDIAALLALAERDCFISASLTATTRYAWRVNGREVSR